MGKSVHTTYPVHEHIVIAHRRPPDASWRGCTVQARAGRAGQLPKPRQLPGRTRRPLLRLHILRPPPFALTLHTNRLTSSARALLGLTSDACHQRLESPQTPFQLRHCCTSIVVPVATWPRRREIGTELSAARTSHPLWLRWPRGKLTATSQLAANPARFERLQGPIGCNPRHNPGLLSHFHMPDSPEGDSPLGPGSLAA